MSEPTPPKIRGFAIVWAGDLAGGVRVRDRLRAEGLAARVVDAGEFQRSPKPELPCTLLVFCAARDQAPHDEGFWTCAHSKLPTVVSDLQSCDLLSKFARPGTSCHFRFTLECG